MPGTAIKTLQMLVNFQRPYDISTTVMFVLPTKNQRSREVKQHAQGHTANKYWSWDTKLANSDTVLPSQELKTEIQGQSHPVVINIIPIIRDTWVAQ